MTKDKEEAYKYFCNWCGHEFENRVRRVYGSGSSSFFRGKQRALSNQIRCPMCGNFIKTWE